MKSSSVREILKNWPTDQPKPKALYTVPVCSLILLSADFTNLSFSMVATQLV
jgi:hypothetical protein